jgi:hypothetical protein
MSFLLYIIAYFLYLPLSIWNFCLVTNKKGYFISSAITIDKLANREFRTLLNKTLKKKQGYSFGAEDETISSALGKNKRDGTLSKTGEILCNILDFLDENHCIKSIKKLK